MGPRFAQDDKSGMTKLTWGVGTGSPTKIPPPRATPGLPGRF